MKTWDKDDVKARFREAVLTMRRLPPVRVQGYFNCWPEVVLTPGEIAASDRKKRTLGPPTPQAIDRMDEVLEWTQWISDKNVRKVLWLRAEKVPWKELSEYEYSNNFSVGRTTEWKIRNEAYCTIAGYLNAREEGGRNV